MAELQDKAYSKDIKWQNKIENNFALFYLESPCTKPKSEITFDPTKPLELSRWKENCEWDLKAEDPFPYLNYRIKVPEHIAVYLSTIMDGDINVTGASHNVHAQNVNGSITIEGAKNILQAKTVNGDIKTTFRDHPNMDGEYSTINGDIRMHMKTKPDLAITFKSFMGDFYTDVDELKVLPDRVIQKTSDENKIVLEEYTRDANRKRKPQNYFRNNEW